LGDLVRWLKRRRKKGNWRRHIKILNEQVIHIMIRIRRSFMERLGGI